MNAQAQNAKPADEKKEYEEMLREYNVHSPFAKNVGENVLTRLLGSGANQATLDLNQQIAEAAKRNETDKILELSSQLQSIKDNEKTHAKSIAELRKSMDWPAIKQAFRPEFEALAYEVALLAMKDSHAAIASSKQKKQSKRGTKATADGAAKTPASKKVYEVKGPDLSLEITLSRGKQKWTSDETSLLKALNFKYKLDKDQPVFEEGQLVKNADGSTVAVSRSSLAKALAGGAYEGFSAKLKDNAETPAPAQA